jgi:hypothetical protein
LVSGALWGPWWQPLAWIGVLVAAGTIAVPSTLSLSGQPLGFIVGWNLFWGLLIGVVAMWGAQLNGAGWALESLAESSFSSALHRAFTNPTI